MTCVFLVLSVLRYCNEKIFKKSKKKRGTSRHLRVSLHVHVWSATPCVLFVSASPMKKSPSVLGMDMSHCSNARAPSNCKYSHFHNTL